MCLFLFFIFLCLVVFFFFFFSSRRRHTRCLSDWSSDVCSSDLAGEGKRRPPLPGAGLGAELFDVGLLVVPGLRHRGVRLVRASRRDAFVLRSEERRVGKECERQCAALL